MSKGEEEAALALIRQYVERYQAEVEGLARAINYMSQLYPQGGLGGFTWGSSGMGGFRGLPYQGPYLRWGALLNGHTTRVAWPINTA
jgi:hypothetical protein